MIPPTTISNLEEIKSKRKENSKVFKSGKNERHLIFCNPIHYEKDGVFEDIDIKLNLEETDKFEQYLSDKNEYSVGFRNDLEASKLQGIRLKENQFELTPHKIILNTEIPIDIKSITTNDREIEHSLGEDSIYTRISETNLVTAIKTNKYLYDFKIVFKIDLNGFTIKNLKKDNEYIPINNEFIFDSKDRPIKISTPLMWNELNCSNDINHRLYEDNGELFYEKTPNEKGIEWLLSNEPTFYIDGTIYYGDTKDGYLIHSKGGTNWNAIVTDTTSSAVNTTSQGVGNSLYSSGSDVKNPIFQCRRAVFIFDTSGIADDATLLSAKMQIHGTGYKESDVSCYLFNGSTTLSTASWNDFTGSEIDRITKASWSLTAYNEFDVGTGTISKTSYSSYMLRDYDRDVSNSAPARNTAYSVGMYFSDASSAKPYLDIEIEAVQVELYQGQIIE